MQPMSIEEITLKIHETEKEYHSTKSWKRKKDLGKYLRRLNFERLKRSKQGGGHI